jgi:hypothetical protein
MTWQCDGCGNVVVCDPLAGDDWPDGTLYAVGPDCEECDCPMECISEEDEEIVPDRPETNEGAV